MTTQNATPTQPQEQKKPERKFEAGKYGLTLLVVAGSYLLTLALGSFWMLITSRAPQQLLNFLIPTTLFFALIAVGITVFYRPAYVPRFPIKPIFVSVTVMSSGLFLLLIWIASRQPDEAGQLRVIMMALVLSALGTLLGFGIAAWYARRPTKPNTDTIAMFIAVFGSVLSALVVPALLRIDDPTVSMKLSIFLLMLGFVLFFALMVLQILSTPDVKPTPVPDGHVGIVTVKGRIARVSFDKSIDVKLQGEVFKQVDMRLQHTSLTASDCLTADHVPTDVKATIEWKLLDTEEGVRAYHTRSVDPQRAIRELAHAAIVHEIGQRASLYIAGREDQIADGVKRRLAGEARHYGMQVKEIAITHALLKYPTPAESMSPLTEVSRLNVMDPAVRKASRTTVKHAEAVMNAEAAAINGNDDKHKEDKTRDEDAGKSHG